MIAPWNWKEARRTRLETERLAERVYVISTISQALRETTVAVSANHHVTYAQRPPAPRPVQLTLVYQFQNGQEYREYVQLHGQSYWDMNFPHYVEQEIRENRPLRSMRVEMRYQDGGML
jgi:hypothetical protein